MATNVDDSNAEAGYVVLEEQAVLEKFNGEIGSGNETLAERVTLVDGVLTKHEWFDENGEVVKTEQFNEDGSLVEGGE